MSGEDERAAFIDELIERARARWRGALPDEALEQHLARVRVQLFTHPVAMEYVARSMPRKPPQHTEERANSGAARSGIGLSDDSATVAKVVGDD